MPRATKAKVFEAPGLERLERLRPEVVARLELLRIVYRPERSAALAIEAARELEKYVSGMAPE